MQKTFPTTAVSSLCSGFYLQDPSICYAAYAYARELHGRLLTSV